MQAQLVRRPGHAVDCSPHVERKNRMRCRDSKDDGGFASSPNSRVAAHKQPAGGRRSCARRHAPEDACPSNVKMRSQEEPVELAAVVPPDVDTAGAPPAAA